MGIMEKMEAGIYSIVETQWDTTNHPFNRHINTTVKSIDKYAKVVYSSNMDEHVETNRKHGGTLLGVSGRWSSKVDKTGSDNMGRWSWADLRGINNRMIQVILTYRVSHNSPTDAGELTYCKQQLQSILAQGKNKSQPEETIPNRSRCFYKAMKNKANKTN